MLAHTHTNTPQHNKETTLAMIDTVFYDRLTSKFSVLPDANGKTTQKISVSAAGRITAKANLSAWLQEFSRGAMFTRTLKEIPLDIPRSNRDDILEDDISEATCIKNGVAYRFMVVNGSIVPIELGKTELAPTAVAHAVDFFRSAILCALKDWVSVPLEDKRPEDYAEFSFFEEGFAPDATGIVYEGFWDEEDDKTYLLPGGASQRLFGKIRQEVSVDRFLNVSKMRWKEIYRTIKEDKESIQEKEF